MLCLPVLSSSATGFTLASGKEKTIEPLTASDDS
jgi:hypothetical protein